MNTLFINEGMNAVKTKPPVFSVEDLEKSYSELNNTRKLTPELIAHAKGLFDGVNGHMPELFKGCIDACAFECFLMTVGGDKV